MASDALQEIEETFEAKRQRERAEAQANFERQMELGERQVTAQERLANLSHTVKDDHISSFFDLPQDQQDFRIREESIAIAARLGGSVIDAISNAESIANYIKNGI